MQKENKQYKIYSFFSKFKLPLFGWFADILIFLHFTANMITAFRLCLIFPSVLLVRDFPLVTALILLLNWFLDGVDGTIAKKTGKNSYQGAVFDASVDNFIELPIVLSLIFFNMASPFWASLYLVVLMLNHFTNYFRYGFGPGKYRFSFSKYCVYTSLLILGLTGYNILDIVFVFWIMLYSVFNIDNLFLFLKNAGIIK